VADEHIPSSLLNGSDGSHGHAEPSSQHTQTPVIAIFEDLKKANAIKNKFLPFPLMTLLTCRCISTLPLGLSLN
jgi:hypothetical protein